MHASTALNEPEWKGKNALVVGSNNSAHDISAALHENGAAVTMLQRSSTHIVRSNTLMELGLGSLYSREAVESGIDVDLADLIFASIPYGCRHLLCMMPMPSMTCAIPLSVHD